MFNKAGNTQFLDGEIMSMTYFFTAEVSARSSHRIKGKPATHLVLKNRGVNDATDEIQLFFNGDPDTFLLRPSDSFLIIGPGNFTHICYKKTVESGHKVRLDVVILR
jgi:hypothetical protein